MRNKHKESDLILEFQIQEQMENSFKTILEKNTAGDLDIENKNVSINSQKIEYSKTDLSYHRFQTNILDDKNRNIGYFVLIVSNNNETIDEYFVIE
jgi:hypothetical protein